MIARTPGPWTIDGAGFIVGKGMEKVAVAVYGLKPCIQMPADTAFIVTACNAHDELVAALQKIAAAASGEDDAGTDDAHTIDYIEDCARAALVKVQP